MKTKVIVIGGKGGAVVVGEQIYDAQMKGANVEFLGYAFDDESFGTEINGFPIVAKTKEVYSKFKDDEDVKFIFQLYRPDLMNERIDLLKSYHIPEDRFYTFIHPSCVVSPSAKIGVGVAIMANSVVNSNVVIGNHCTIHSNSLIGHDTKMGNYNFVAAHNVIGSNNNIGRANFLGLNSTFNNYLNIGDNCFVGMASNVIKSIPDNVKVYGNPAKPFTSKIKAL
ncbi:sugar O-acyltransferase, sialic acid O-acetyltransferase NeuD family [Lishizhenia tianjinensis]|uniref:Sugar O-acyltransferase, sialic acid O-acetyltransferase NeuD family n=1 Tax=Lishizhenia tianjinensis TaxID=477690 RepID=A0A1I6ZJX6_9FLAO|nr:acetyltransferase [Lishizhenia tianjinensis]SFT62940.1 sugar O-acyltransferase, sialic acid O-acetyltransferase NeuD family [Lishizhenia tianjinensis]